MPENKPERNNTQPSRRFFNSYSGDQQFQNNTSNEEEVETVTKATVKGTFTTDATVSSSEVYEVSGEENQDLSNQKSSDSFSGVKSNEDIPQQSTEVNNQNNSNQQPLDTGYKPDALPSKRDSENKVSDPNNSVNHMEEEKKDNYTNNNQESPSTNDDNTSTFDKNPSKSNSTNQDKDIKSTNDNHESNSSLNNKNENVTPNNVEQNGSQRKSSPLRRNSRGSNDNVKKDNRKNSLFNKNKKNVNSEDKTKADNKDKAKQAEDANKAIKSAKDRAAEAKEAEKKAKRRKRIIRHVLLYWKIYLVIGLLALFLLFVAILVVIFSSGGDGNFGGRSGNVSGPINRRPGTTDSYKCQETIDTPISVKTTPLTRNEFIEKVKSYETKAYKSQYDNFKMHAGDIYDLAIGSGYNGKNALGVNPEMVVIRAFNEGFAPGVGFNYWGIGKCNTCAGGGKYGSFMEGVEAYFHTIMKYDAFDKDDIYGVMSKYAYIGDNWYYPGDSSRGGCYYKKYIIKFLQVINPSRANDVERICRDGTQDKTTADDQLAYAQYQVETNIMSFRKSIFGLENTSGSSSCQKILVTLDPPKPDEIRKLPHLTAEGGQSVSHLLNRNKSSVNTFNDSLRDKVISSTPGTRKAVVNAAVYTINTFYSLGYRLPYSFSGGHSAPYTDVNGQIHDKISSSYFGINPYIGEGIYVNGVRGYKYTRNGTTKTYNNLGLDCSGFVTWALKNGGIDRPISNAVDFKNDPNVKTYPINDQSSYVGQPGDVLASDTHVALIIKFDKNLNAYLVAEESDGLIVSYYTIDSQSRRQYSVVDMSYYYDHKKIDNYASAFKEGVYKV